MKMSDKFMLPVRVVEVVYVQGPNQVTHYANGPDNRLISHAVNHHDALVGVLKKLVACRNSETEEDLLDDILYLLGDIADDK